MIDHEINDAIKQAPSGLIGAAGIAVIKDLYKRIAKLKLIRMENEIELRKNEIAVPERYRTLGACTINNVSDMYKELLKIKGEYTAFGHPDVKYIITRMPTSFECTNPNSKTESLRQKSFIISGHNIEFNAPNKLHGKCKACETEAVYRQTSSKVKMDPQIYKEFVEFAHNKIDEWIQTYDHGLIDY